MRTRRMTCVRSKCAQKDIYFYIEMSKNKLLVIVCALAYFNFIAIYAMDVCMYLNETQCEKIHQGHYYYNFNLHTFFFIYNLINIFTLKSTI